MDSTRAAVAPLTTVADRRSPGAIGRQARLELVFALKRGRTALVHAYAEPPHHIGQARSAGRALAVTIVCTGPGVFSGDDLRQSIRVESGAQVLLSSQAALQVHAGVRGCDAQVRQRYDVEADGELHCRWDPVIPFAGARFSQDIDLQLAASSRLYWSDALMSGRVGCGESWASATLSHHLRLSVDDRLTYLERYRLDPPRPRAVQPWLAASASFFGTALIYHPA
ncbi:MAG TPA: urease accessory protein UreD, partial [Vicinamibacterales bacterium]|nr:urease accessory protein UreD [Vicinamibacterales bacterium]